MIELPVGSQGQVLKRRQGRCPCRLFSINFEQAMQEKKSSTHEKFVTVVIAAIMIGLFLKVLFF
jgi:hypothetical protein